MKKIFVKIFALSLSLLMLAPALVSCAPPKLEDVRDTFIKLIEESAQVNEILFGNGLSTYGDLEYDEERELYYTFYYTKNDGRLCAYYDKKTKAYKVLRVGKAGEGEPVYRDGERYFYATELTYEDDNKDLPAAPPAGFDFVRTDERCTSVSEILSLASTVYSEAYLRELTTTLFAADESYMTLAGLDAKYAEYEYKREGLLGAPEETIKLLMRASRKSVEPLITEERTYDYDTMRIMRGSRKDFVTVEISSYGVYPDFESEEVKIGWKTTLLSFVRENGKWRLDTPTY